MESIGIYIQKNSSLNNVTKILLFTYNQPIRLLQISLRLILGAFQLKNGLDILNTIIEIYSIQKQIVLDAVTLSNLYQSRYLSALRIGCEKLQTPYKPFHDAPLFSTLFILDAYESKDLVDFWNLRAIHQDVRAVPIQWIEELLPFCKQFLQDNDRHQSNDPRLNTVSPILMFSRSLSEGNVEENGKRLLF